MPEKTAPIRIFPIQQGAYSKIYVTVRGRIHGSNRNNTRITVEGQVTGESRLYAWFNGRFFSRITRQNWIRPVEIWYGDEQG